MSTSLVITKSDLSPDFISEKLSLNASFARLPGETPAFREGVGCWTYGYDESFSPSVEDQLQALSGQLESRRAALAELVSQGYSVQIDITGSVETGVALWLSPTILNRVKELGVPLSFTSRCAPLKDEFDWLS
ncbi:DUF4279 domain-containing protein [Streptantibioticus rubrisoli]|uniref:DUF4279 domain-containing protein n=1 Tax=Streptantibioticus rubrisoli TaxID=1387313 RepID=A0ABT1PKU0_9ACTN|nr:DUF4279 domain-containing protein [Streptantibioticus rubrisoli]MCQ4045979.1 DUF4279 domain-containing protein [Streptantibioticus rubrisoli]